MFDRYRKGNKPHYKHYQWLCGAGVDNHLGGFVTIFDETLDDLTPLVSGEPLMSMLAKIKNYQELIIAMDEQIESMVTTIDDLEERILQLEEGVTT